MEDLPLALSLYHDESEEEKWGVEGDEPLSIDELPVVKRVVLSRMITSQSREETGPSSPLTRTGTFGALNTTGNPMDFLDSFGAALLRHKIRVPPAPPTETEKALDEIGLDIDTNGSKAFVYNSLETSGRFIRILTLLPSESEDSEIRCLLRHADLDESPKFASVSYTWGDPRIQIPVQVNGEIFPVTENLFRALQQLRTSFCADGPIALWVDAICINQSDTAERSSQVQLMPFIYGKAQVTLLWLGEEEADSGLAIDLINMFGQGDLTMGINTWKKFPLSMTPDPWNALYALFNRPFWHRTWILQEFVLSGVFIMICGRGLTYSHVLEQAYFTWFSLALEISDLVDAGLDMKTIDSICEAFRKIDTHMTFRLSLSRVEVFGHMLSLLDVVSTTWRFDVTDPRDRVFGLLGFSIHNIAPDYSKPTRDIYSGFARNQLEEGRLDVLFLAGSGIMRGSEFSCSLPSWVPDFQALASVGPQPWFSRKESFSAGNSLGNGVDTTSDLYTVEMTGIVCGEVREVIKLGLTKDGELWPSNFNGRFWDHFVSDKLFEPYPGEIPRLQALFRTLVMDEGLSSVESGTNLGVEFYDMAAGFLVMLSFVALDQQQQVNWEEIIAAEFNEVDALLDWLNTGPNNYNRSQAEQLIQELFLGKSHAHTQSDWPQHRGITDKETLLTNFLSQLRKCTSKTSFFWTDNGSFGLGPMYCKESDIVCIVPGLNYPLILRSIDDDNDIYEFVGPCFILGYMYGEAAKALDTENLSLQDFEIR